MKLASTARLFKLTKVQFVTIFQCIFLLWYIHGKWEEDVVNSSPTVLKGSGMATKGRFEKWKQTN